MDKCFQEPFAITPFTALSRDISNGQLQQMNALVGEGVDQLQALHGLSRVFHAPTTPASSARCRLPRKMADLICMHAENGSAIDVIVQQALAEGKKAPKYHALTGHHRRGRSCFPRDCLGEMAGAPIYIVH